jgi:hypothetical protein
MLGKEGRNWGHKLGSIKEHVKECVQRVKLIFSVVIVALHSWPIQTDIPVGKILKERKSWSDNVVQFVRVHFVTDVLDQVLVGSDNPVVSEV